MNLYSYIVADDTGFAPNPFYGYCTLATCKPGIRRKAEEKDWIIGVGSKENGLGGKLVYAMQVTEILSFGQYFKDERFCSKKPKLDSRKQQRGDNIYELKSDGSYRQLLSLHNKKHKDKDTSSKNVLISNNYVYFGANGPLIPELKDDDGKSLLCKEGNSYEEFSLSKDKRMIEEFKAWIKEKGLNGYVGNPLHHYCDWACAGC